MSKLFGKIKTVLLVTAASVFSVAATAQETAVSDAAAAFGTTWAANAALVGGALIAAAFVAIGYKWVKGMIFG